MTMSLVALGFTATSCSSAPETDSAATTDTVSSSVQVQTMTAQVACDKFFSFDLYRRTQMVSDGKAGLDQRKQALKEYRDLASTMAVSLDSAVTVGDLPARVKANADRIVRQISQVVTAGGDIRDAMGPADAKVARSADRIEKACVATGHPLPPENVDARNAARDD